jgi:putative ABC transport system substrate-binding protein
MSDSFRIEFSERLSDYRKSKSCPEPRRRIQNPKWLGRPVFIVLLAGLAGMVEAQQQPKMPKIGWFTGRSASGARSQLVDFQREFRSLGYLDGQNITFEFRYADNKLDRLPALAAELIGLKVDVLIASSPRAALAARNATKTIPIVFYGVADPVALGLVDSLARPGGNLTGVTFISDQLAGKRLELLKETVPKLSRIAVLWNPENPGNALQWKASQLEARALGLALHSLEVRSADNYEDAFKQAAKARNGALAVTPDTLVYSNLNLIMSLLAKYRLPAISDRREFVEGGGLMSYGADEAEQFRRVVWMIDKIIKGAKPADIPVEQPTKFELVINLKTAKALGLTIPPIVLMRAQRVVK